MLGPVGDVVEGRESRRSATLRVGARFATKRRHIPSSIASVVRSRHVFHAPELRPTLSYIPLSSIVVIYRARGSSVRRQRDGTAVAAFAHQPDCPQWNNHDVDRLTTSHRGTRHAHAPPAIRPYVEMGSSSSEPMSGRTSSRALSRDDDDTRGAELIAECRAYVHAVHHSCDPAMGDPSTAGRIGRPMLNKGVSEPMVTSCVPTVPVPPPIDNPTFSIGGHQFNH